MRSLYSIRTDIHAALERLYSLKTKKAKDKVVVQLKALRNEGYEAMHAVFKEGDVIALDHLVNCTNVFGGGGWGINGTIKIVGIGSTSLDVECSGEVFEVELLEDWKRWGSDSFWAFETALRERGQDIGFQARDHAIASISRHLKGALSCRNARSVVNRDERLRDSKHFRQRIQAMIGELRNLKNQQFEAVAAAMANYAAENNLTIIEDGVGTYTVSTKAVSNE